MNYLLRNSLRRINSLSLISSSSFTTITSLKSSSSLLLKNKSNLSSIRSLSLGKGYDVLGDVDEENPRTNINAYGKKSFSVTNVYVTHSVALFPRSFLLWNARKPCKLSLPFSSSSSLSSSSHLLSFIISFSIILYHF